MKNNKFVFGIKEFFRKEIVKIKRKPHYIPLIMLAICCLTYMLNMTEISDTTALVYGKNMGLLGFASTMFSILVLITMMNAYPNRQKARLSMVIITFVIIAIIIACDFMYYQKIVLALSNASTTGENLLAKGPYISKVMNILIVHVIFLIVSAVLIATLPIYSKLLQKINTKIVVESDVETLAKIELEE